MVSYYDVILGLIPLSLFGIAGSLTILGVQSTVAVPAAALVAVGLIGHALFVNGPVEAPSNTVVRGDQSGQASARSPTSTE